MCVALRINVETLVISDGLYTRTYLFLFKAMFTHHSTKTKSERRKFESENCCIKDCFTFLQAHCI